MIGARITLEWEDKMEKRHQEAQQLMDRIDQFLAVGDIAARHVEAILTGLRGPDNDHILLKTVTTLPIRRAALPCCVKHDGEARLFMAFGRSDRPFAAPPATHADGAGHFLEHARKAWTSLQWLRQPFKGTDPVPDGYTP